MQSPYNSMIPKMISESRARGSTLYIVGFVALCVTLFAGYVAVAISQKYYSVAPFHYDSASYLSGSLIIRRLLDQNGLWEALKQALAVKDSLDMVLRLLVAPASLSELYGHLIILLPFLFIFLFLIGFYTYKRSESWIYAFSAIIIVFCSPILYNPFWGIADYWKDNLAVWLLGSAIVSWILSEGLKKREWAFSCGLLLGLLAMQRTALAVYAAILFGPPFMIAFFKHWKNDGLKIAISTSCFVLIPSAVLALVVAGMQWKTLYEYYFVGGYAYSSPSSLTSNLTKIISANSITPILVALVFLFVLVLSPLSWRSGRNNSDARLTDVLFAAWFVLGFPVVLVITLTNYPEYLTVWSVFFAIFAAVVMAIMLPRRVQCAAPVAMLIVGLIGFQYSRSQAGFSLTASDYAPQRKFYDQITDVLLTQKAPHFVALLYDEDAPLVRLHMYFHRNIAVNNPSAGFYSVGFASVHDSYYRAKFGVFPAEHYFEIIKPQLEAHDGTLAVVKCSADQIAGSGAYGEDGKAIAIPVAALMTEYLSKNSHWRVIDRFDSHRGCLYAYRYSSSSDPAVTSGGLGVAL